MTVKELECAGLIRKIRIQKEQNHHSVCEVRLLIEKEEKLFKLRKLIGEKVCVEDERRIYMRGTVRKISCNTAYSNLEAVVEIVSYSDQTDMDKKNRIFQDVQKKYRDIFSKLNAKEGIFQVVDSSFANLLESKVMIQENQTDFAFVVRTANMHGYRVFVNDTDSKCVVSIGKKYDGAAMELSESDMVTNQFSLTREAETLYIETRQYLEFGHTVRFENQVYVVIRQEIAYENGTVHYKYVLEREIKAEKELEYATGFLGKAKVVENGDPKNLGRIRIHFTEWEDSLQENAPWIAYIPVLTEKTAGECMIPDKDEVVFVFAKDGICYASGCIREQAFNEKQKNVENRTIFFRDKKITMAENKMEVEGFSYKLKLEDQKLKIENDTNSVVVENDKLVVRCGNSKINMNKDTAQIITDSKVEMKADQIHMDGSSKITAKTSSFDVG